MSKKALVLVTIMMVCVKSFGLDLGHDEHHDIPSIIHDFYHSIGQPHQHDEHDESIVQISFSDEAYEHIESGYEAGSSLYVFSRHRWESMQIINNLIDSISPNWDPPYIKLTSPPPKPLHV
ncbi:MAG: hypothetical protein AAGJ37_06310 [Pseudomonadota bacterium]